MRHNKLCKICLTILLILPAFLLLPPFSFTADNLYRPSVEVYFSPDGGCTSAIVKTVSQAKKTVYVQAYSFTSAPIARALIDSKTRGVDVRVIYDFSQQDQTGSKIIDLRNAGIPVLLDNAHNLAHDKIMIIDGDTVITGSFNFTNSAEYHNAENLLILRGSALANRYMLNWKEHAKHSKN